jgi:hypothetical protein
MIHPKVLVPKRRYGITEKKKAELDSLTNKVLDAQYDVYQLQAVVASISDKSQKIDAILVITEADKTTALNNRNLVDQVVENALTLRDNSEIVSTKMAVTNKDTKNVADEVKILIDKLIYCADMINKLSVLVVRKKALNPLISDDLISKITDVGKDANNAVALTLVALQSIFVAQESSLESEAAITLEYLQSDSLYGILTGKVKDALEIKEASPLCLQKLLSDAYDEAKKAYKQVHSASKSATKQLNQANADLNKAQIKLASLQSGLAAGTAAALAS